MEPPDSAIRTRSMWITLGGRTVNYWRTNRRRVARCTDTDVLGRPGTLGQGPWTPKDEVGGSPLDIAGRYCQLPACPAQTCSLRSLPPAQDAPPHHRPACVGPVRLGVHWTGPTGSSDPGLSLSTAPASGLGLRLAYDARCWLGPAGYRASS